MDTEAIFAGAAINRRAFADLLDGLDQEQLATQSLCGEWDVQTVGAHLATAITAKVSHFLVELLKARGSFDRANSNVALKESRSGIAAIIAKIRANADSRFTPPGTGPRAPLTDVIVHTGDVARPLGLPHDAPDDHVRTALEFLDRDHVTGFVAKGWRTGLSFVADDLGTSYGTSGGAELHGRGIDLLMATCGRPAALATLTGPGVEVLAGRIS
jgi:uncharacterized protein (TIGR03083 family)